MASPFWLDNPNILFNKKKIMQLDYSSQARLRTFLVSIADGEKQIDLHREILSEQPEFNPRLIFNRLAKSNGHSIDASDLIYFLSQNDINDISMFDLGSMMTKFD